MKTVLATITLLIIRIMLINTDKETEHNENSQKLLKSTKTWLADVDNASKVDDWILKKLPEVDELEASCQ